jgi:hypothetical protein
LIAGDGSNRPVTECTGLLKKSLNLEMMVAGGIIFQRHAIDRWVSRAETLGYDNSIQALVETFNRAVPEQRATNTGRWHLFTRSIIHGAAHYLVADGWRFVVHCDRCIEVERIRPHENYRR